MKLFIVFEGGEGSGKTIQSQMLADYLKGKGLGVFLTKEPGGDASVCRDIRTTLLNPDYKISSKAELLLFAADRAQHVDNVIAPELEKGNIVICDRFDASTYAYQVCARGVPEKDFKTLNNFAKGKILPDFTFWLDVDPAVGLRRNANIGKRDRLEKEDVSFHQKVRAGYKEYFKKITKNKHAKIDASKSIEEIHREIIRIFEEKLR
ncbi:MAG: dTMP kinase [Patescibacteria group bacterium]|nr:dTMP kinase [Patescibacteria group bacterium]